MGRTRSRARDVLIGAAVLGAGLLAVTLASGQPETGDSLEPLPPGSGSGSIPELPTPSEVESSPRLPPTGSAATPAPTVQEYVPPPPPPPEEPEPPEEDAPETLFGGDKEVVFGGFGGLNVRYTRVLGHDSVWVGGEGALLLNHAFSVGGGGGGIANEIHPTTGTRLEFGYGGLILRYHFFSSEIVNFAVGGLIGAGSIGVIDRDVAREDVKWEEVGEAVFVLEPELGLFLNITRWMRVGVTGGYRFVSGVEKNDLSETDVRGAAGGGAIQFGWF